MASLLGIVRRMLLLLCAALLGYGYAAWVAQNRLADKLPDEWQGKNIVVTGIVAEMPRMHERGLRFAFDVENCSDTEERMYRAISSLPPTIATPKHPLKFSAGQRWQLTVRLKQPHGSSNPYNFDFEMWALERNIRAIGYVYAKGDNIMLAEQTGSPAYLVQRLRETVRTHFQKTLSDAPYTGVLTALGDRRPVRHHAG